MLEFLKTNTIKDTVVVTAGMILSTILSAASVFLLARFLGPADFGLYTAALAITVIVIDALELAISNSIIKFSSRGSPDSAEYLHFGFNLKLKLGFAVGAGFALLAYTAGSFIHPQLKWPLLTSALIIPAVFWSRFPRSILKARKRFLADVIVENITSGFRLAGVGWFYVISQLTVITGLISYLGGNLAGLLAGIIFVDWNFLHSKISRDSRRRFFKFQQWLTLGFIVAAVHNRIDSVMLLKLAGADVAGIYQAAYRFFMPVIQLASVLSLVFAPRFASFPDRATAGIYLGKAARLALSVGAAVLLIIPLSPWLVGLIFGGDYLAAIIPAQILAAGFFAFIAGAPWVAFLLYFASQAKAFFLINLLQLVLIVSLNWWLIPRFQAVGAAVAASVTLIVTNLLIAGVSCRWLYAGKKT